MHEEKDSARVGPSVPCVEGTGSTAERQSGTVTAGLTDLETRLVRFIRAMPGWIRMQIIFPDGQMDRARFLIADALEEEINAKLKCDHPDALPAPVAPGGAANV